MRKVTDYLRGHFSSQAAYSDTLSTEHFLKLIQQWQSLVGDFVGSYTVPHRLKNTELHVATLHPTLAQELSFMEKDILLSILKHYPQWSKKIKTIVFHYVPGFDVKAHIKSIETNRVIKPSKQAILAPNQPLTALQRKELLKDMPKFEDEELQTLLSSLISKI